MIGEAILLLIEVVISTILVLALPIVVFGLFYEYIKKDLTDMAE